MKNFFKKLAFVLALAMVVTTLAPAATASAAAAPVLNTTGKKLYLGGDKTGKYSEKFTLKVWNKGDYRVTFASDNTAVATVSKWYGVVEAKAVGTATITATVSNKETGKVVTTLAAKVYVKKNATSVAFGSLKAFDQPLVAGDKVKINVARKAGDVTAWKQADKTQISDYVVWTSSNTDVATVDKWGTVTAVAPGETTISAVAMQIEGKVATTDAATVKVTVVAKGITEVAQKTATKLEVTFGAAQDTTKVTKDTLIITPAEASKTTPVVKEVKWNDAKTVATVEVYVAFEDKAVYTVSVKDTTDAKDFTASVGDVANVTITGPSTVVAGDAAVIEYVLKDANGVELNNDDAKITPEIVDGDANGYISKNEDGEYTITVFEKGKTLAVQLEYHTGDYSNEGVETSYKSNAFVVTGVDKTDATLATSKYTISKDDYAKADFDNKNSQITLADFGYSIEAYIKDSADAEYKTTTAGVNNFTFESMDPTKVEVDATGKLYPVAVGTAYVKVTVKPINKSFLVQVVVAAKAKPASLAFDKYTATVTSVDKSVSFKATIKDQYGKDYAYDFALSDVAVKVNGSLDASAYLLFDGKTITFETVNGATKTPAGTYTFKVTVGDYSRNITVIVKNPEDTVKTYSLVLNKTSIDMARNNDNDDNETVTVTYYGLDKNGYKTVEYIDGVDFTVSIKNSAGTEVANTSSYDVVSVSGSVIKKADKTGTYTVTLTALAGGAFDAKAGSVIAKSGFSVTDTQVKPVVKQDYTKIDAADFADAFSVSSTNSYADNGLTIDKVYGYKVGDTSAVEELKALDTKSTYVITKVDVKEVYDNGNYFVHSVTVNKSLKTN